MIKQTYEKENVKTLKEIFGSQKDRRNVNN